MGNIYIYSEPVRSGKTTAVMNWLEKTPGAAGFLTPDIYEKKKLYDISTGDYFDFEVDTCADPVQLDDYTFDNSIFKYGQELLLKASQKWPKWLVIDEVGKLEIEQKQGWEPALTEVIKLHDNDDCICDMLLVIRDSLLHDAISHYSLHAAIVLDKKFFMR